MCGRYTLSDTGDLLEELDVEAPGVEFQPRYNIAPTQDVAAICASEDEKRHLAAFRWGLIPHWSKDMAIGNRMINARSETVAEKPSFRTAFKRRRCLILTDGFYEWRKVSGGKQPYHIHRSNRRPFVFAGLWERWTKGEAPIESCTILTTAANETVAPLHHRMPVILDGEDRDTWLDPTSTQADLMPLFEPAPNDSIAFYPVSRMVGNPRNQSAECMQPIESLDQ